MSGDKVDRPGNRTVRAVIWAPGLAVAIGAAAATAHGLYEVAVAARVPAGIAWLYPLITDGLALVAYTATARLDGRAARYAWAVVVIAAGLSGLAQAAFLAGQGGEVEAPAVLRFGVGAWPAVAAAVVAHLLYLLASEAETGIVVKAPQEPEAVQRVRYSPDGVQPAALARPVQPVGDTSAGDEADARAEPVRAAASPLRDRAEAVATRHARRRGAWPTVSELEAAAEVSRGTAAAALKALRAAPLPAPHLLPDATHVRQDQTPPSPPRQTPTTSPRSDDEAHTHDPVPRHQSQHDREESKNKDNDQDNDQEQEPSRSAGARSDQTRNGRAKNDKIKGSTPMHHDPEVAGGLRPRLSRRTDC